MPQADMTPFAGLATPEVLKAQRRAKSEAAYADAPFWMKRAASYGTELDEALTSQGIGLNDEDRKALVRQRVLLDATKEARSKLAAGELSPDDAQRHILQTAMEAFVAEGDYESASQLAPQLKAWQAKDMELFKVRSEIGENQASALASTAAAGKDFGATGIAADKAPLDRDLLREKMATERARQWSLLHPTASGAGGGPGKADVTPTDQGKFRNLMVGASSALDRFSDVFDVVLRTPAVAGNAAATLAGIQNNVAHAAALAEGSSTPIEWAQDEAKRQRLLDAGGKLYEGSANKLNIARAQFDSLTMDLAYTLARARDPGGRLSDADVANALRIIGAAGDPQALTQVLSDVAKRTYSDITKWKAAGSWYSGQTDLWDLVDKSYGRFGATVKAYTKPEDEAPAAQGGAGKPAPAAGKTMTPAERAAIRARARAVLDRHGGAR